MRVTESRVSMSAFSLQSERQECYHRCHFFMHNGYNHVTSGRTMKSGETCIGDLCKMAGTMAVIYLYN